MITNQTSKCTFFALSLRNLTFISKGLAQAIQPIYLAYTQFKVLSLNKYFHL